jgi:hypothetical protein
MKTRKSTSFLLWAPLALLLFVTACGREGFEGDANVSGKVAHHLAPIAGATVYIKFNAKELPGTTVNDFDASVLADSSGTYLIEGLKKGDYYLYGFGYDTTISDVVRGGLHITVAKGEVKTADIAVTE